MRTTLAAAALAVALGVAGCGGSSSAPATTAEAAKTTPAGAPGSVSAAAGGAVPLGLTRAEVEDRIGPPATPPQPRPDGFRCMLYLMAEQPPYVKLQYCFRGDRLKYLSTYAIAGDRAEGR